MMVGSSLGHGASRFFTPHAHGMMPKSSALLVVDHLWLLILIRFWIWLGLIYWKTYLSQGEPSASHHLSILPEALSYEMIYWFPINFRALIGLFGANWRSSFGYLKHLPWAPGFPKEESDLNTGCALLTNETCDGTDFCVVEDDCTSDHDILCQAPALGEPLSSSCFALRVVHFP